MAITCVQITVILLTNYLILVFQNISIVTHFNIIWNYILFLILHLHDRLCGLVVRVLGYRSGGPGSIPVTTTKKSSGSGTGSTQTRKYK
jgi:hypothetical protein